MLDEPIDSAQAKKLVRQILEKGTVEFTKHALIELNNDNLSEIDAINVLRGGWPSPAEFENGSWRYRFETTRICVVVSFRTDQWTVIITAWRKR